MPTVFTHAWVYAEAYMANITKKGALEVTSSLDRVAELFERDFAALGVSEKVAKDFAYRCDILADHVSKHAGFDPKTIGKEVSGPLDGDKDEPFMKAEFSQQENRELGDKVDSGALGAKPSPEQASPHAGKQASSLRRQLQAAALSGATPRMLKALALAAKIAEEEEKDEEDVGPMNKKEGGEMPPQFKENAEKKKEEAEGKDEEKSEAKKAGELPDFIKEKKDEAKEDKKDDGKKASHGFNLFG